MQGCIVVSGASAPYQSCRQLGKARNVADRQVLYGTLLPMYIVRDIIAMLC